MLRSRSLCTVDSAIPQPIRLRVAGDAEDQEQEEEEERSTTAALRPGAAAGGSGSTVVLVVEVGTSTVL